MAVEDFLREYYTDPRPFPDIKGKCRGGLVICGDAACVWDDLEAFGCRNNTGRGSVWKSGYDFMTINKLVEVFPGEIRHAYSNEPNLLANFIAARRNEYRREFGAPQNVHSIRKGDQIQWVWPFGGFGTSALPASMIGVCLGYDRIVLCGIPLDDSPHNGEPHWRKCAFISEAASPKDSTGPGQHWKRARDMVFEGKVRSMSGRTREWFGAP